MSVLDDPAADGALTYRGLLGRPWVARALAGALVGRLPTAMTALALTLTLRAHGAGFRFVGLATALLALSLAVGGPVLGRLVDRRGQTAVLCVSAVVSAAGLLLVALAPGSRVLVLVGAATTGAATPPLEPCLRALWPVLVGPGNVQRAYSVDAAAQELVFIGGPLLVATAVALGPPEWALVLTAALCLAGVLLMATARPSREWRGRPGPGGRWGPLHSRPLLLLLAGLAGSGAAVGGLNIVAVAYAERHAVPGGAGTLLALSATGALIGALANGRVSFSGAPTARAAVASAALATAYLLVAGLAPVPVMAVVCVATGVFLSPLLVVSFVLVDAFAPEGTVTEAFAWLVTLFTAGTALGSAVAGSVLAVSGARAAAASTAGIAFLGTGVLLLCHRAAGSRARAA